MNMNRHRPLTRSRAAPARSGRLAIAALVALTLALTLSRDASAAAGLTASENPVIVPYGMDTKAITLSWDLGGALAATLTVTDDQQKTVLVQWVTAQTPPAPLTVTYGRTYTAKLVTSLTQAPIGPPLTITTKRPLISFDFDFGCLLQCITAASVEPHGTYGAFSIATNEKVYMTLTVSKATASGTDCVAGAVAGTQTTILPVTAWSPQIAGLSAGTLHRWTVQATDANGNKQSKSGCFTTLKRSVAVTVQKVTLNDDSDGFGAGACDCKFYFWAGSNASGTFYPGSGAIDVDTGNSIYPNVTVTVSNAPTSIAIGATGNDDDTDFGQFCPYGYPISGSGSNSCHDWSSASTTVAINATGPGEAVSGSFHMSTGGAIAFEVWGAYKVAYVP